MPTTPATSSFHRSKRTEGLQLSEIVRISEAARARRADGHDVLSFGTGEPDFPTPPHVIDAAMRAARDGQTTYTPTAGVPALRTTVARTNDRKPQEVLISTGAKQVLCNAFQATLDPDDEVIVPAPYWASYSDIIRFCGARLVAPPCGADTGFRLTPERLEAAITDKTRWLLLNSPGNPSGAMYSAEDLKGLAEVLRTRPRVWTIADEIYEHIAHAPFVSFPTAAPDLVDRTLVVNGVSKAYAMTGWRIGWGIGPAELIQAMTAVQGQCTSGASSVSQAAALTALRGPQDLLKERRAEFRKRRDFVTEALNAIPGISCPLPEGAFYVFPDCTGCLGKRTAGVRGPQTDEDFCHHVLSEANVALIPGSAFGMPGHFRLSYACSMEQLREGCERIAVAVAKLEGDRE